MFSYLFYFRCIFDKLNESNSEVCESLIKTTLHPHSKFLSFYFLLILKLEQSKFVALIIQGHAHTQFRIVFC